MGNEGGGGGGGGGIGDNNNQLEYNRIDKIRNNRIDEVDEIEEDDTIFRNVNDEQVPELPVKVKQATTLGVPKKPKTKKKIENSDGKYIKPSKLPHYATPNSVWNPFAI